ncbi:YtxH domain-containing protein [Flavobacterium ardleyense]|uniref:YtxH domain-containing protein n=1 Tax=Flavobacterium ardleyense TaxID=2038737 RepID=UPI00298CE4A9|nr:YtxH domain-containing protein [Flavobacterium ardleyense]
MSSSKTGVALALLAGVAIGAGIGILMAPEKGSKTRKKIKGGYCDATDDLKNKYKDLKKKVSKVDVEGKYEELVDNLSHKSEDVVSFLETKLASLKKQVAKY